MPAENVAIGGTVTVENLREVARAIRTADKQIASNLRKEFRKIANSVLGDVRAEAPSHLPRRWQAKARTAYKAGVDNDRAYIKIGPARTGAGQIARIFEVGSARNRGYIRHPLWPKPDTPRASWKWADGRQPINPALPAIFARHHDRVAKELQQAVAQACADAGINVKVRT